MNSNYVNEFLTIGLKDYFNKQNEDTFEYHVVKCLAFIYDETELKRAYDAKNEEAFTNLIRIYELPLRIYSNFLADLQAFEDFNKKYKSDVSLKTDTLNKVDEELIIMYKYKSVFKKQSPEEVKKFEDILLKDYEMIKLRINMSDDPDKINKIWLEEKKTVVNYNELEEVKPKYLDNSLYVKYGTNLKAVTKMDYRMVEKLNKYILGKEKKNSYDGKKPRLTGKQILHTSISSGNGFVDVLCMVSIIATEISIGLIYFFLHLK